MGMEPQGKATDEEMEKFEKAKKMAAQQAKDTAPEQRKAVGLSRGNVGADEPIKPNVNDPNGKADKEANAASGKEPTDGKEKEQEPECECGCPGKSPCENKGASTAQSFVPFYGSYLDMTYRWERGEYIRSVGNFALMVTDIALVKAIFFGFGKATLKAGLKEGTKRYFGVGMSHEYGATVSRLSRLGVDMSGYKHHWLISQSLMDKYTWLKPIGNQAWNFTRFSSQADHMRWAHGYKFLLDPAIPYWKFAYPISSTPSWFKLGSASASGHIYSILQKDLGQ